MFYDAKIEIWYTIFIISSSGTIIFSIILLIEEIIDWFVLSSKDDNKEKDN